MELTLDAKIEGILFYKGEPVSLSALAKIFGVKEGEINDALVLLEEKLQERGITLLRNGNEVTLGTSRALSSLLEKERKEELGKELSKAALETIAIILYRDGVSRSEIDYIRGVNSSFILRNLQMRGLVERLPHPDDSRKYVYRPTFDLLSFMGVSKVEDLPDYNAVRQNIAEEIAGSSTEE